MRGIRTASAALIISAGLILTGCATTSESAAPTPTTTAEPKPSTTAKPTPTPTAEPVAGPSWTFDIPEVTSSRLLGLSFSELAQLDVTERGLYTLYWANKLDIKTEADLYASITKDPNDKLPDTLSLENTPQEILAWDAALTRLAFSAPDPRDPSLFDRSVAEKIAVSATVTSLTSPGYSAAVAGIENNIARDNGIVARTRSMALSNYAAAGQATGASEIYTSTTNNPAIDIQVTEPSGNSGTATFEWVTFTNGSSAWLQK